MLFLVHIVVDGKQIDSDKRTDLLADERRYSQRLQQDGKWVRLWRVVGQWANYSVFEVSNNEELHDLLSGLPLFPYLRITVTPLAEHPSRLSTTGD